MMEMIVGHELVVTFTRNGEVVDRLYCGNRRLAWRLVGAGPGRTMPRCHGLTPGEFGTGGLPMGQRAPRRTCRPQRDECAKFRAGPLARPSLCRIRVYGYREGQAEGV
jgi:hypothetical protein